MVITIKKKPLTPIARHVDEYVAASRELVSFQHERASDAVTAKELVEAQKRFVNAHKDVVSLRSLLEVGEAYSRSFNFVSDVVGKDAPASEMAVADKYVSGLYDQMEAALDQWPGGLPEDDEIEKVGEVTIELSPQEMRDLLNAGVLAGMEVVDNWEHGDLAHSVHSLEEWARDVAERLGVNLDVRNENDGDSPSP